jgi:hypothetical protein
MSIGLVESVVGTRALPASMRGLCRLPEVHYADVFTLSTAARATPEQWARAMFGDVPSLAEQLIWRVLLHLRLSRGRSPDTVGGWTVGGRGEDWIRLEASSWHLHADLVVRTARGGVSLGTFLHHRNRAGGLVWTPLSAVHRALVPGVLLAAARRVRATG